MNWDNALLAMQTGATIIRGEFSELKNTYLQKGVLDGKEVFIWQGGEEPFHLADAMTDEFKQVRVFQGVYSKRLFIPNDKQKTATDWVVFNEEDDE